MQLSYSCPMWLSYSCPIVVLLWSSNCPLIVLLLSSRGSSRLFTVPLETSGVKSMLNSCSQEIALTQNAALIPQPDLVSSHQGKLWYSHGQTPQMMSESHDSWNAWTKKACRDSQHESEYKLSHFCLPCQEILRASVGTAKPYLCDPNNRGLTVLYCTKVYCTNTVV